MRFLINANDDKILKNLYAIAEKKGAEYEERGKLLNEQLDALKEESLEASDKHWKNFNGRLTALGYLEKEGDPHLEVLDDGTILYRGERESD